VKSYKRITTKDREDIASYYGHGVSQLVISEQLVISQSMIYRELKRGAD